MTTVFAAFGYGRPVEWLAIAGGAALGAFVCGLIVQLLCRSTTGKKLPPFPLLTVRVLGGLVAGFVTGMFVLNGGGNGLWPFGGFNGSGDHAGQTADNNPKSAPDQTNAPPPTATQPDKENTPPTHENTMRVEVLTRQMLDQLDQSQVVKEGRYYRLPDSADPKALHTKDEVETAIKQRLQKQPPLKHLAIIGPDQSAGWVEPIQTWAKQQGLSVDNFSW